MKFTFTCLIGAIALTNFANAATSPTHHLCAGLYAHKEKSGDWHVYDPDQEYTEKGHKSLDDLLFKYCGHDDHAKIHTARKNPPFDGKGAGYFSFEAPAAKW